MESVSVVFICDTELWDEFECKVTSSSFHLRKKGSWFPAMRRFRWWVWSQVTSIGDGGGAVRTGGLFAALCRGSVKGRGGGGRGSLLLAPLPLRRTYLRHIGSKLHFDWSTLLLPVKRKHACMTQMWYFEWEKCTLMCDIEIYLMVCRLSCLPAERYKQPLCKVLAFQWLHCHPVCLSSLWFIEQHNTMHVNVDSILPTQAILC